MSQSKEFFAALAKVIHTRDTATFSATTDCWRLASISVKAGEIYALRYGAQVGLDALSAFQVIQVESFSHKPDCSNLLYKPMERPVSNQRFLDALSDRIVLPRQPIASPVQAPTPLAVAPPPAPTTAPQLKYRGQTISPVSEAPVEAKQKSAKIKTWVIQHPENEIPQLSYRGQPVTPVSRQPPGAEQSSAPAKTWDIQYRGHGKNPFRRRDRVEKPRAAA